MATQHIPGPWASEPERRFREQIIPEAIGVRGPGGTFVAAAFDFNRYDRDTEVVANTRLIAAAPQLLAAAEVARDWFDRFGANAPIVFGGEAEVWQQLSNAIARARDE